MTKITKKCNNDACVCSQAEQHTGAKETVDYGFYSKVLKEPFDSLIALRKAEDAYYAKLKAKEDKAAEKKADAQKVEEAFKALNAARKVYKEGLVKLTEKYSIDLKELENTYKANKKELQDLLSKAEVVYSEALKAFTTKYPEGYHLTLKDGDFETTISGSSSTSTKNADTDRVFNFFDWFFNI